MIYAIVHNETDSAAAGALGLYVVDKPFKVPKGAHIIFYQRLQEDYKTPRKRRWAAGKMSVHYFTGCCFYSAFSYHTTMELAARAAKKYEKQTHQEKEDK
jgi:hypothetical protein